MSSSAQQHQSHQQRLAARSQQRKVRKPKRPQNARKRVSDDVDPPVADGAGAASGSSVVRAAKAAKANALVQSTAASGAAPEKPRSMTEFAHDSDRRISNYDNKATASNEQDTDASNDAQAQYEAAQNL